MAIGLISLTALFLKETQHLQNEKMIMMNLLILIATNSTNVVVIVFALTILDSNRPIPVDILDVEDMVGVGIVAVE